MLSDVSELSDISSDDNAGQTTKAKEPKKKSTGYRLRNVLKPGRTTQYTAKALYGKLTIILVSLRNLIPLCTDQIEDNDINLDPEYQRGELSAFGISVTLDAVAWLRMTNVGFAAG